jgi:hypothetical protein
MESNRQKSAQSLTPYGFSMGAILRLRTRLFFSETFNSPSILDPHLGNDFCFRVLGHHKKNIQL